VQAGEAVSKDMIGASAQAFLQAINRLSTPGQLEMNWQTQALMTH
jgi:hypothetical protein